MKLDVQSLARDATTGGLVRFKYTGKIDVRGGAGKVLRGGADAGATGFGEACEFSFFSILFYFCCFCLDKKGGC